MKKHGFIQVGLILITFIYFFIMREFCGNISNDFYINIIVISFLGLLMITIGINIFYIVKNIIVAKQNNKILINKKVVILLSIFCIILVSIIGKYYYNQSLKNNLSITTIIFHRAFNDLSVKERDYYLAKKANIYKVN